MTTPVEPRIDVVRIDPPETPGDVVHSYLPARLAGVVNLAPSGAGPVVLPEWLHKSNDRMSYIHRTDGPSKAGSGLRVWLRADRAGARPKPS
jgi:hypothetical protein